ncbi:MAG TPA: hypothetical protein VMV46_22070 [Thermoanaerobaculia bacterium]|nr:hypothetical protein [Thermoanaerobaculia bacterium]
MTPVATTPSDLDRWALSLLSSEPVLLDLARRVALATGAPVLGGLAVFLHGYRRTTEDIDLQASDPEALAKALRALGAEWDGPARQFVLEGVPIHLVTEAQTGGPAREIVEIRGIPTVSLPDLVRFKLHSGLDRPQRAQDLADVVELIRRVPLGRSFAARLPREQRAPFRELVDAVRDG